MTAVYSPGDHASRESDRLLLAIAKASTLHVGAAAAAASLRDDLTTRRTIADDRFNELFAAGRLTPGTTLFALEGLLGYSLGGWPTALIALVVATALPSAVTLALVVLYVSYNDVPTVRHLMDGAQAGAFAVSVWAAVRLGAPVVVQHRGAGAILAVVVTLLVILDVLHPILVLLIAAAGGGLFLRAAR